MPAGAASTRPANAPERSAANPRTRQRAKGLRSGEGGRKAARVGAVAAVTDNAPRGFPVSPSNGASDGYP